MPDNGDKILEAINGLKNQMHDVQLKGADTNNKVSLIQKGQETMDKTLLDHTQVLYGDPKQMGVGGLIHKQSEQDQSISEARKDMENSKNEIKKDIKNLRGFFTLFWTGFITAFNVILNFIFKRV